VTDLYVLTWCQKMDHFLRNFKPTPDDYLGITSELMRTFETGIWVQRAPDSRKGLLFDENFSADTMEGLGQIIMQFDFNDLYKLVTYQNSILEARKLKRLF